MTATPPPILAAPFLKSVGGKRQLVPQILPHVPATFGRYHESFLGGGAVYFALHNLGLIRHGAVLSEANRRTARAWMGVRDDVETVIRLLRTYRYEREAYYEERARPIDGQCDAAVAAWRIYISKCGFNGLFRENRSGGCNVPFGRYKNPKICDAEGLRAASRALQGVEIRHEDFAEAAARMEPGDFAYFDPPYAPLSETASFTGYTAAGFGARDHARLRDALRELKARGVHVLASNSSAPLVSDLYADGFTLTPVQARRAVSCQAEGRGPVREFLIA